MGWQSKMTKTEKLAAEQYLKALQKQFPEIAKGAYYRPNRDTVVFIYADVSDEETLQKIRAAMLPITTKLSVKYRTIVVLVPKSDWSGFRKQNRNGRKHKVSEQKHETETR